MAYEEIYLIIGIVSTLTAVFLPFIFRGMNKGEKQIITSVNFSHLQSKVDELSKTVDSGFSQATRQRGEIIEQSRKDMRAIYDQLAQMSSDIRLHTNQIAQFCIEVARMEDRLRKAEGEIIRNERSRVFDKRASYEETNGSR